MKTAERQLLDLANDCGGVIRGTQNGNIVFVFPSQIRRILAQKYLKMRIAYAMHKMWIWLLWILRISFGLMLLLSIVVVAVAIILLWIAINSQGSSNGRGTQTLQ